MGIYVGKSVPLFSSCIVTITMSFCKASFNSDLMIYFIVYSNRWYQNHLVL